MIHVDEVYVLDFALLDVEEHTCVRCGYAPRPYIPSNLRMDLWSTPCVVDVDPNRMEFDDHGRLVLDEEDVDWLALCGNSNSNDKGWVGSPLPDEGAYGGNNCLGEVERLKAPCVPLQFESDDK